jgi:hypothetical protein
MVKIGLFILHMDAIKSDIRLTALTTETGCAKPMDYAYSILHSIILVNCGLIGNKYVFG